MPTAAMGPDSRDSGSQTAPTEAASWLAVWCLSTKLGREFASCLSAAGLGLRAEGVGLSIELGKLRLLFTVCQTSVAHCPVLP